METKLDEIADTILKKRPPKAATLVLMNEEKKQYTVINLGDWRVTDRKPFDLFQAGFIFISKYQAGLCAPE